MRVIAPLEPPEANPSKDDKLVNLKNYYASYRACKSICEAMIRSQSATVISWKSSANYTSLSCKLCNTTVPTVAHAVGTCSLAQMPKAM